MSVFYSTPALGGSIGLLALVLAGCASTTDPVAPGVGIGPESPNTLDDLVLLLDGDDAEEVADDATLAVRWSVDGQDRADLQGQRTVPASLTAKGQTWSVQVTPIDGAVAGEPQSGSVDIVNAAPAVTLDPVPVSPSAEQDVVVSAQASDPDDDDVTLAWSWTLDGTDADVDGPVLPAALTERGQVWQVQVVATDGEDDSDPATADISIANRAPTVQGLSLTPSVAFTDTTLTASGVGVDPDGDPVEITWAWYVDGEEVSRGTERTLDPDLYVRGDAVLALAIPSDGFVEGAPVSTPVVEIRNSVPQVEAARIDQETVLTDTTVTCSGEGFVDADGDSESYRASWEVDGRVVATSASLSPSFFSRGQSVVCVLVPVDDFDEGRAVRSAPRVVANSLPVLESATIAPAEPTVSDTLSVTLGDATDADGDDITYRYSWLIDGNPVGEGPTLASGFSKGQDIAVSVEPFDGLEAGEPVVAATVTVANTAPVVSSVSLSPADPVASQVITASVAASDLDGDDLSYRVTWTVDGSIVDGVTGLTLPAGSFVRDQEIVAEVVADDGDAESEAVTSAPIVAVNSEPSFTDIAITPDEAFTDTALTCAASGFEDADDDEEGYRYAWSVNGSEVATTESLPVDAFVRGDTVQCTATAYDGVDEGTTLTSAAIEIRNAAPVLTGLSLSSAEPRFGETLSYTLDDIRDADGDEVTELVSWTVDGEVASTDATLSLDGIGRGAVIELTVTPRDEDGLEGEALVASVTVANTAPVVDSVAFVNDELRTDDTLTAVVEASDVDGDELELRFTWYVGGAPVDGATGTTLSGDAFVRGEEIYVEVTADDGDLTSEVVTSGTIEVLNSAPSVSSVSLSPEAPRRGDEVTCAPSGWSDPDGDEEGYDYAWSTGETTATLSTASMASGTSLSCTVTPNDGDLTGDAVSSETVELLAPLPTVDSITLPELARTADEITATVETSDEEEREVSVAYSWTVDSEEVSTDTVLSSSFTSKGASVQLTATPSVGDDVGTPVTSSVLVISNTAPEVESVALTPAEPTVAESIIAVVEATDADADDTLTVSHVWTVGDAVIDGVSGPTLSSEYFVKGNVVSVSVEVSDGDDTVEGGSAAVTVQNSAPTEPTVAIVGRDFDEALLCDIVGASTDADVDDEVSYSYAWTVDGEAYEGSGAEIPADATEGGQLWECTVVATDDDGATSEEVSASVTVRDCRYEVVASEHVSLDTEGGEADRGVDVAVLRGEGSNYVGWLLFPFAGDIAADAEFLSVELQLDAIEVGSDAAEDLLPFSLVSSSLTEWTREDATSDVLVVERAIDDSAFTATTGERVTVELDSGLLELGAAIDAGSLSLGVEGNSEIETLFGDFVGTASEDGDESASGDAPRLLIRTATCD